MLLVMNPETLIFVYLIIFISFTINNVISYSGLKKGPDIKYCNSSSCIHAAKIITDNMDKSIDPCNNFYQFACGNFIKNTVIPPDQDFSNGFSQTKDEFIKQFSLDIKNENLFAKQEPDMFKNLRKYYKLCTEDVGANESNELFKKILTSVGSWPILTDSWDESKFNWNTTLLRLNELGFTNTGLIAISVTNNVINKTKQISINQSPLIDIDEVSGKSIKAYYNYMVNIAVALGVNRNQALEEFFDTFMFELELRHISEYDEPIYTTISKLQSDYPIIQWLYYLNEYFKPYILNETEQVIIEPNYLMNLDNLLKSTSKRTLANYIFWRVVYNIAPYLSAEIQNFTAEYKLSLGIDMTKTPRWISCTRQALDYFPVAMSSFYIRRHVNRQLEKPVQEIIKNIINTIQTIIEKSNWLDSQTAQKILEKLQSMTTVVGFPKEYLDNEIIDDYYKEIKIVDESYFETVLASNRFRAKLNLKKLEERSYKRFHWTEYIIDYTSANAFYNRWDNLFLVVPGVLQGFYYQNDRPDYLNYGVLGSIIGHEIFHSFDATGRVHDERGNPVDWWGEEAKLLYEQKINCIRNQYNSYFIPEIGMNLEQSTTLNEDIADNGGVKAAYRTFKTLMKNKNEKFILPELEQYSSEQMFWIAYANSWCEKVRPEKLEMLMSEAHGLNQFRVLGPLQNSYEFANDFKCPKNSPMNPISKCLLF